MRNRYNACKRIRACIRGTISPRFQGFSLASDVGSVGTHRPSHSFNPISDCEDRLSRNRTLYWNEPIFRRYYMTAEVDLLYKLLFVIFFWIGTV